MPKPRATIGRLFATILSLGIAGSGCSLNPVSRQPEMVLVSEQTEVEQGREAAEQVAKEMGLVKDGALNLDFDDEVTKSTVITHGGAVVSDAVKKLLEPAPAAAPGGNA